MRDAASQHGAPSQHVVLFVHIPKAAGTTVRGIFFKECCADNGTKRTWQSANGYKASADEILQAVAYQLQRREPRIFTEHHMMPLRWLLPERMKQLTRRYGASLHSFTLWREPLALLASNWQQWWHRQFYFFHDFLAAAPEFLLFGSVNPCANATSEPPRGFLGFVVPKEDREASESTSACAADPETAALCKRLSSIYYSERDPRQWCGWDASERRRWAERVVSHRLSVERTVSLRGCASIVREAYHRLEGLTQVLPLEDNRTIPRIVALAASRSSHRNVTYAPSWLHRLKSLHPSPLEAAATMRLAREKNPCSLQLNALVRRQLRDDGSLPPFDAWTVVE